MRIGLVVHFFDFRNDVRVMITELLRQGHQVVVFHGKDDAELIKRHAPEGVEFRPIDEKVTSVKNKLWEQSFSWMGKLPESRRNFQLMELFKISLHPSEAARDRARKRLFMRMRLPETVGYDTYLKNLTYSGKTKIDDLDRFVFFTDIYDSYFLARVLNEDKPLHIYVYSWDHPCKHVRYTKRAKYLVWNQGIKDDVAELQHVASRKIEVLGANQFGYVDRYYQAGPGAESPYPFKYVYFGCAIGLPGLVQQETEVVRKAAKALAIACPDWKMVVRPYPVLKEWHHYESLRSEPNIVLDDGFRTGDRSITDDSILQKFRTIAHAEAFLHLGTTLGLEAAFTDTPSFILDLTYFSYEKEKKDLALYHFVHQYQNDKYLIDQPGSNVFRTEEQMVGTFGSIMLQGKQAFLEGNRQIRKNFPVKSFEALAADLVQVLQSDR